MDKTFLFDLDDTLIENQTKYTFSQAEFITFVAKRLGYRAPDAKTIINMQVDIDHGLVKSKGFAADRFSTSFREAYKRLCETIGIKDKTGEEEAYYLGGKVFNEERWLAEGRGLLEGVPETLDFLVSQGDELRLVTLGDTEAQKRKIETYGLRRWFEGRIDITAKKDSEFFRMAAGDSSLGRVWVVGNSIRSDVLPALSAGLKMIYIPCETWDYDKQHNGLPEDRNILKFDKITDLKTRYAEIV